MSFESALYKNLNKTFFSLPMMLDLGGDAGFELRFDSAKGFFVEFGGGGSFAVGRKKSIIKF